MLNATQSYKQAQVNTVGRADITLMLYDGLLRFLDLAAEKMEQKQIQDKGNYISRALDIINELDSTLNMEKGGEISKGLHNLYLLTNKNLLMANLKNDLAILKSVRANMQVVRDSFYEAMQTEEAKEMLMKMGPVPVQASNGNAQMKFGGSIQERADKIKEAQQKAEAIKRVQAKLANAKNDEEKSLAKKELEELLGKNIVAAHNKPVSMSMAQKASRAFMQQQGLSQVSMQMKMQNQTMQVNSAQAHSAQGNPAHVSPAAQTAPAAQLGQQNQTEQAAHLPWRKIPRSHSKGLQAKLCMPWQALMRRVSKCKVRRKIRCRLFRLPCSKKTAWLFLPEMKKGRKKKSLRNPVLRQWGKWREDLCPVA